MVGENTARCPLCANPQIIPDQTILEWVEEVQNRQEENGTMSFIEQTLEEDEIKSCFKNGGKFASFAGEGVEIEIIVRYKRGE